MKPKEFHITIYSISRFIITYAVVVIIFFFLLLDYVPKEANTIVILVSTLVLFSVSFYLARLVGSAKIKIVFTEEAFLHIWERKFLFSSEKDIKISWDIMDDYVFERERGFNSFIINLTINQRYKINKQTFFPFKDDFDKFRRSFPVLANRYLANNYRNQTIPEEEIKKIKRGESFFASQEFKWIYYAMIVGFTAIVIGLIIFPNSATNKGSLMILASTLVFYGIMLKTKNKKK